LPRVSVRLVVLDLADLVARLITELLIFSDLMKLVLTGKIFPDELSLFPDLFHDTPNTLLLLLHDGVKSTPLPPHLFLLLMVGVRDYQLQAALAADGPIFCGLDYLADAV